MKQASIPVKNTRYVETNIGNVQRIQGVVDATRPVIAYRGIDSRELNSAKATGKWNSTGTFTSRLEKPSARATSTMFGTDPEELASALSGSHPGFKAGLARGRDIPNYDMIVEADISGLPFTTLRKPTGYSAGGHALTIPADLGLGLGINSPIPIERIRSVRLVNENGTLGDDVTAMFEGALKRHATSGATRGGGAAIMMRGVQPSKGGRP